MVLYTSYSEYVDLYQYLRSMLPIKEIITDVITDLGLNPENLKWTFKYTVYEDNKGALIVATFTKLNPSPKFMTTKYNWFR